MGADKGVLIDDEALNGSDILAATKALTAAVKELEPDIVLCGHRSVDYDEGQRGAMAAEFLDWPHLPMAVSLECDGEKVVIERTIEGGKVTLEADLPALVTMGGSHAVWNPRYASLPGIMKSKKKPLDIKKISDLGLDAGELGPDAAKLKITSIEMPPQRTPGRMIEGDDAAAKAKELVRALHEEAKVV
jgi:electron transfer flavoprotein beta subunit